MNEQLTDEEVERIRRRCSNEHFTLPWESAVALAIEVQEYRALRPTCPMCGGTCVAVRALTPVSPSTCIHCEQTITLHGNGRWYHTGGWECCRLGSPSSPVATPPTVDGDVPCPDCTDGKMPLDKWVPLLLAQCVRQRALLDEVRCCPVEHVSRNYRTVHLDRPTWDALHAIGSES